MVDASYVARTRHYHACTRQLAHVTVATERIFDARCHGWRNGRAERLGCLLHDGSSEMETSEFRNSDERYRCDSVYDGRTRFGQYANTGNCWLLDGQRMAGRRLRCCGAVRDANIWTHNVGGDWNKAKMKALR